MNQDLLRIIDGIARDRNIDREVVLEDLEAAMLSAVRKAYGQDEDAVVTIDRQSGEIRATVEGQPLSMSQLSRIAAQTAKQVMIQKFREAERGSIQEEYLERRGQIVTGRTIRWEGGGMTVDLGRAEAIIPKSEQIPGETHLPDERIRAMVLDVREQGAQVRIILTRTHPDFIRRLFDLEVPEVAEKIIELKALAREAGYRTKVAVHSLDPKVDPVGACVGVRGSRIKNIVDEVAGEKIDIVRWHESSQVLIGYALKPAEVADIALCFELGRATVVVNEDQLSLAIGKRGQNVRLAARLTGWDIDILTPVEFNAGLDALERALREVEGVEPTLLDRIVAMGMVSAADVAEVGLEPLIEELEVDAAVAEAVVQRCQEEARRAAQAPKKSGATETDVKDDETPSEAAAPVADDETAAAAPVADDETAAAAPVADDEAVATTEQQDSEGADATGDAGDTAAAEPQA